MDEKNAELRKKENILRDVETQGRVHMGTLSIAGQGTGTKI
jgi:hypothetical protein